MCRLVAAIVMLLLSISEILGAGNEFSAWKIIYAEECGEHDSGLRDGVAVLLATQLVTLRPASGSISINDFGGLEDNRIAADAWNFALSSRTETGETTLLLCEDGSQKVEGERLRNQVD